MKQRRIPKWLLNLPPAKYSLLFLVSITQKRADSIIRTLKRLKVEKEYYAVPNSNLMGVMYDWNEEKTRAFLADQVSRVKIPQEQR